MCAGAVETDKRSKLRGGLVNVPMAGKELAECVVCGVCEWVVGVTMLLEKTITSAMGFRERERERECVPIGVTGHRNRSTCHFRWSWRFGGAVAHVCVSDCGALRYLTWQHTFVLVSGSTSHMRDIVIVSEYTKASR